MKIAGVAVQAPAPQGGQKRVDVRGHCQLAMIKKSRMAAVGAVCSALMLPSQHDQWHPNATALDLRLRCWAPERY